jgi:hypothetical protein
MVDLSQSSLNFLAGIVAQMEAVYEAIGNDFNHLAPSSLPEPGNADDEVAHKNLLTRQPPASHPLDGSQAEAHLPLRMPVPMSAIGSAIRPDIERTFPNPVSSSDELDGVGMGTAAEAVGTQHSSLSPARCTSNGESDGVLSPNSQSPVDKSVSPAPSIPPISRNLLKRYNREDIYDRVWRKPIWQVAKDLCHTEHALCNACIKLYIPTPPRGYWGLKPSNRNSIARPHLPNIEGLTMPAAAEPKHVDGPKYVSALLMSRYDREKLYEEVWNLPLGQVGALYSVCDTAIYERCRKLHIPTPGPDYWQKKALGRPLPERPLLPSVIVKGFSGNSENWDERKARFGKRNKGPIINPSRRRHESQ